MSRSSSGGIVRSGWLALVVSVSVGVSAGAACSTPVGGSPGDDDDGDGDGDRDGGGDGDGGSADAPPLEDFSFFVTSLAALDERAGDQGFGGDLRYGETGPGAGLRGADKICREIAEDSMPGSSAKTWRAFLSAAAGEDGEQVDAIDRIGEGPWYDRLGRLVAATKDDLLAPRPGGGDLAIVDDLPNEDGVPNHQPDPGQDEVDNHHMLTGSGTDGRLYDAESTCLDWTAASGEIEAEGRPRVGLSWPRNDDGGSGTHWISAMHESGCLPGINLAQTGGPDPDAHTVGSGGGYGGFYCFALSP